jgi:hypothetical protein
MSNDHPHLRSLWKWKWALLKPGVVLGELKNNKVIKLQNKVIKICTCFPSLLENRYGHW